MKTKVFILTVVALVLIVTFEVVTLIFSYNGLVRIERDIVDNRAQVVKVCQKRLEYLSGLIQLFEVNAGEEKVALATVNYTRDSATGALGVIARARVLAKDQLAVVASTQEDVSLAVKELTTVASQYPKLQNASRFWALLDQFSGTELQLSAAGGRYNAVVHLFNSRIGKFPGSVNASLFGFSPQELFETRGGAGEAVYLRSMGAMGPGRAGRGGPRRIEVSMEDPIVAWLIFLDILVLFLVFFFIRNFNQKRELEILAKYYDQSVLLVSHAASFLGQESKGRWQFRGKGILLLTDREMYFEMGLSIVALVIPLSKIQKVEIVESHLGRTKNASLLKVVFINAQGQLDSGAWLVRNVDVWKLRIEETQKA